jgi:hypothetical protein
MARVKGLGDVLKKTDPKAGHVDHAGHVDQGGDVDQAHEVDQAPAVDQPAEAPVIAAVPDLDPEEAGQPDEPVEPAEVDQAPAVDQPAAKAATGARKPAARAVRKSTPAKTPAKPATRRAPVPDAPEIEVRSVATSEGKKVSIYFHPDDYRELLQAKVDVGADFQALLRSMVALWREDPRFHSKVNRLAQRAPRGGQR